MGPERRWTAIPKLVGVEVWGRNRVAGTRPWCVKQFDSVLIEEGWGRTERFEVQVKETNSGERFSKARPSGHISFAAFPPTTARHVRLNILQASNVPTIWEFQLFDRFEGPK